MHVIRKKISVISVSRSDFSILFPLLKLLKESKEVDLKLYITGGHLRSSQGTTIAEVRALGFEPIEVLADQGSETAHECNKTIAHGLSSFSEIFHNERPDCLIIMGDRFDMFSAALAAVTHRIPICHIHGGEVTSGAFDDQYRHAITKFSHLHCVAHEDYAKRVIRMGEDPCKVLISGAPALDNLRDLKFPEKNELFKKLNLDSTQGLLLITFHPETMASDGGKQQVLNLISALRDLPEQQLFTMSNIDPNSNEISDIIYNYAASFSNVKVVKSLGMPGYYHVMRHASAVIGNSSSGILETPSFGIPCVNIGNRQRGRIMAKNIISCEPETNLILESIRKALSSEFADLISGMQSPFYKGGAAIKILPFILEALKNEDLFYKKFYDYVN